jgi:uncharacterized membrane protein affecting hemolysin expression
MWATHRSSIVTVIVILIAVVVGFAVFNGRVQRARQGCEDAGGQVVIVSDPTSIGQYCVYPSGSRDPI